MRQSALALAQPSHSCTLCEQLMTPRSKHALRAALFPSSQDGSEHTDLPDAWRQRLIGQRPDIRYIIFCSCRAGRDWVLSSSPHAQLTLVCYPDAPPFAWLGQLRLHRQALSVRQQPTSLTVLFSREAGSTESCALLLAGLRGGCACVSELTLELVPSKVDKVRGYFLNEFLSGAGTHIHTTQHTLSTVCGRSNLV